MEQAEHKKERIMMRRICVVFVAISLMASLSYAEPFRENTSAEGKSGFNNIAVVGRDIGGVPGYIELTSGDTANKLQRYYLYVVAETGELYIASASQGGTTSTAGDPQVTDWLNAGTKVGAQ